MEVFGDDVGGCGNVECAAVLIHGGFNQTTAVLWDGVDGDGWTLDDDGGDQGEDVGAGWVGPAERDDVGAVWLGDDETRGRRCEEAIVGH